MQKQKRKTIKKRYRLSIRCNILPCIWILWRHVKSFMFVLMILLGCCRFTLMFILVWSNARSGTLSLYCHSQYARYSFLPKYCNLTMKHYILVFQTNGIKTLVPILYIEKWFQYYIKMYWKMGKRLLGDFISVVMMSYNNVKLICHHFW
jgi:hypothetical protein